MLQEAKILVPMATNDGRPLDDLHRHVADVLTEHFGGVTVMAAQGSWRSPETGRLIREPMAAYLIAVELGEHSADLLRGVAGWIAKLADQECVYLALPGGRVEFVDQKAAPSVALAALSPVDPPKAAQQPQKGLRLVVSNG